VFFLNTVYSSSHHKQYKVASELWVYDRQRNPSIQNPIMRNIHPCHSDDSDWLQI